MDYPIHILTIKLWEWEGVAEKWDMEIRKNGPDDQTVEYYNIAVERVKELKAAVEKLKQ